MTSWVRTALDHEARDDSVERGALVAVSELSSVVLLSLCERDKVLDRLWDRLSVQTKHEPTERLASVLNVKEHPA